MCMFASMIATPLYMLNANLRQCSAHLYFCRQTVVATLCFGPFCALWGPISQYSAHFKPIRLYPDPIKAPMGPKGPHGSQNWPIGPYRALIN